MFVVICTAAFALGVDPPPRQDRYEQIPFSGNLDDILKRFLENAEQERQLERLLDHVRTQPEFNDLARDWLKQLDPNNPLLRGQLQELAQKFEAQGAINVSELQELRNKLEINAKLMAEFEKLRQQGFKPPQLPEMGAMEPPPSAPPVRVEPDKLARWTRELIDEVDDTRVGELLRDSPAWQRGLDRFENIRFPEVTLDRLPGLPEGWRLPTDWTPNLPNLPNWSPGRLPRVSLPRWEFDPPRVGNVGLGGGPRFGGGPGFGAASTDGLFLLLGLVLLALLAFVFYRQLGRWPRAAAVLHSLGPWPVDPAQVRTRRDLMRAFEYLARWRLGEQTLSWNHRAVARGLEPVAAAEPLAQLYEQARYTPGDNLLPASQQDAARVHLLRLRDQSA